MSIPLGQPAPLTLQVRDSAGAPADGGTVTCTVTLPDGTTATPTVTRPSGTGAGIYAADYTPTVPGLHLVRWVVTGANASAPSVDALYVDPAAPAPLVSLDEAMTRLGLAVRDTAPERELVAARVRAASAKCEEWTERVWARRTIVHTRTVPGGVDYVTVPGPIVSLTSVTVGGQAASVRYFDSHAGIVMLRSATSIQSTIAVTYVAGPTDGVIPETVRLGVLELVHHLWSTMRSGPAGPRRQVDEDPYPTGYALPRRVEELWAEHRLRPGGVG